MEENAEPVGQLFTHVYCERGTPLSDHKLARHRLGGYCDNNFNDHVYDIKKSLKHEIGLSVPFSVNNWSLEKYFEQIDVKYVLSSITVVYRTLTQCAKVWKGGDRYLSPLAEGWLVFVARVFKEENMCYRVDEKGGVHYLVDAEFERNHNSTLRCLENPKYAAVKGAFEESYHYLISTPQDTKSAVRAVFEALEILSKLMVETKNLNKWLVENTLKEVALKNYAADEVAQKCVAGMFDGFALWVDTMHNYRHGQGTAEPIAPPLDFTVYALSTGAAFLRWLVDIDAKEALRQ